MHGGQLKWKFARALKLTVQPIAEAVEQAGQGMGQATLVACQLSSSGLHFMCRQFLIIKITAPAAGRRQDNKQVRCLLCQCVDERALGVAEGKGGGGKKGGCWETLDKLCERRWPTAAAAADNGVMTNKSA